jgi:molecular chaperone DnaK
MIRNAQGDLLLESIVYFEDDELLFARPAKQAAAAQPNRAAEYVKRDFGQTAYSRAIGGELLPAEVIEACLLKKVYGEIATGPPGPPPAVVLSIPASFNQTQRKALLDAAQIAGLDIAGTINDPLAAALAFAEIQGYLAPGGADKPGCRVLVFDLGGGTLDAGIIEIKPGIIRALSVVGDARLGGRDWDLRLADHLAEQFANQFGEDPRYDMKSVRRLVENAAEAKHTLTARLQARVHIERQSHSADITITRQAFEDITADLLARAKGVAEAALSQAAMAWPDVAHLLLVGGATRMSMIGRMLETLTGLKGVANLHPEEAVARGAALRAASFLSARDGRTPAAQLELVDLTTHSLGLEWSDPQTKRSENVVIVTRGTQLPCGTSSKLATTADDQRSLTVQLLEGESRKAAECTRVAELTISGLPGNLPKGTPIEVHYQLTVDRRLQVKAQLATNNAPLTVEARRSLGLSVDQVNQWKKLLASEVGLKAVLAHLASHKDRGPALPVGEPALEAPPHELHSPAELPMGQLAPRRLDFDEIDATIGVRGRNRKSSPRQMAIMLGGYVVFSVLGLLIGYYILMFIEPSYNWYHLPLPGLGGDPPAGGAASTVPR